MQCKSLAQAVAALFCVLVSASSLSADYYACDCQPGADVDCLPGNDSDAGTIGAPWQTYERARAAFASVNAGDAVRFCSGGLFSPASSSRWVNSACLAANRCTIGDYVPDWASGDETRPLVVTSGGAHGIAFEDGGDANHEEGVVVENLVLRGSGSGFGVFLYNDIDDVELRNIHVEGFGVGVHLAGSNPCSSDPLCDGLNERIVLRDSTVIENTSQGWLGASE